MKLLIAVLALVSFGFFVPNSYADPVLNVNAGVTGGVLVESQVANVFTWVYTDTNATLYSPVGATTDNNVFTAVYTYVPLGVSVLNVTDVCANLGVLHAPNPCNLDFSFSDTNVGVGNVVSNDPFGTGVLDTNLGIAIGADVNVSVLDGVTVAGLDIGGGSAEIDFPPPPTSATPEPGTLSLMGTGLLGVAGVLRRKFRMA